MTLREAYEYGKEELNIAGIPEFELDAWYLLEYATGVNRTQYFLYSEVEVEESKL
jgi:release factor glutamine methyltransferase